MIFCLILKEEYPCYLKEWLDYHSPLGSVMIYDNNDGPGTLEETLHPYGDRISVMRWPGRVQQIPAYTDCCKRFPEDVIFFIDADEFWVRNMKVIFYEEICREIGALAFNWQVYGSSGRKYHDPIPQHQKFVHRHPYNSPVNHHIKTMTVGKYVRRWINPHQMEPIPGKRYNRTGIQCGHSHNVSLHLGYLNHYFCRSEQEFQQKIDKGRVDTLGTRTMQEFYDHNKPATIPGGIEYGTGYTEEEMRPQD